MSKKKRSKILATLLCATTMAAFYASPRLVYAENLYYTNDGHTVTTDGGGNTAITGIEGLESVTFGVLGTGGDAGVRLYFDGNGNGGLKVDSSFTADYLYLDVADTYGDRYSLHNVLGIHRLQEDGAYVTNIETGATGQGGMQVAQDSINIFGGKAIFSNANTGSISFNMAFDASEGMTVGTAYSVDTQGNIITSGTINSMTIRNNQVNGVTMLNSNVTANTITGTDITDGTYHLSQIGSILSDVEEIDDKTEGIAGYDAMTGTTFTGNVRASGGLVTGTGTISDTNSHSFTVEQAQNVITSVNDSTSGLAATNTLANKNRTDIDGLTERVGKAEGHITTLTGNVTDLTGKVTTAESEIDTLQKVTTGMSYDASSGTKFAQDVTANDFKIAGGTSLSQVATDLTTAQGNIQTNTNNITTLTSKVTTAESEIDVLQTTVGDENSGLVAKTKNLNADGSTLTGMTNITTNTFTATSGSIGSIGFSGNNLTNVASIGGVDNTVTVAGTAIGNGSFNGVTIADYNTNGSHGATINGISIYQDSDGHYNVGTIDLNDLTGSGSGGTVDGIVRTDNTPQDKEDNDYTTTIEGNLEVRTNGTITQRNGDFAVAADGTVTGKDFAVKGTGTTLSGVASNVTALQTTVGNESSGLVKNVNDLNTTVSGHTTSINALNTKSKNLSEDGMQLTGMDNIESAKGKIGGISFDGNAITNVTSIGSDTDTINIAGTAISKGSFNGVNIGVDSDSHATFNGVSIYKDANDYIVGDVNISALKGVSGTEIEGIERTDNTPDAADDNNFTTTIEGTLKVNTDGTFSNANESFKVDVDGNVTGKDFVINGVTSLSTVAQATTGMTYTAGNTTAEGVTSFDHNVHATNFTTDSADLNKLSATVGDDTSGLVKDVKTLESKTQGFSDDGKKLNLEGSITANTGTIGNISFSNYAIGTDSDTITVAGTPISKGSFNGVGIKYENSNYWVGDVNLSELKANAGTVRGITYTNGTNGNYTMNFAEGAFSVSTTGEFTFNYNGQQYGLDKLINTVSSEDLAGFEELKKKVDKLEDKTTGIEFDEGTGSTTINDMDKDSSGNWVKGDNSLTVGDDGITANGDTVINGDTDDNTTGGNGNDSNDPQGGDSIINGDQLVDGDQHVTGDSQFDGTVTVGTGTDGKGQTVIDGGTINTGNTVIDGGQVKADEGHFGNITVGEGDNQTTIGDDGIKVGDNTTIDNSGVSIKDENGNVFMGDHDVVIKDSDGNVEASLSDVANRVDGIEQSIGDLNSRMGELEDRIDKVGAMAAAIANLRTMGYDPAAPTEVAVGIGQYRNETGAALGLFHYPNRDFMLSLSVSTSGDEVMGGIGATWKFGRKSPEKVAAEKAEKAREAKLQKAEAIKEAARLKKIEAQQERHAKLAAQKTATK